MSVVLVRPAPEEVAERARTIHATWLDDAEMFTVLAGCEKYTSDWDDFYGGPLVSNYSVERDAAPLLKDAVKVMALKTAAAVPSSASKLAESHSREADTIQNCHAINWQQSAGLNGASRFGRSKTTNLSRGNRFDGQIPHTGRSSPGTKGPSVMMRP